MHRSWVVSAQEKRKWRARATSNTYKDNDRYMNSHGHYNRPNHNSNANDEEEYHSNSSDYTDDSLDENENENYDAQQDNKFHDRANEDDVLLNQEDRHVI